MNLKKYIRNINDFPKKGIIFRDITPLLKNRKIFKFTIDILAQHYKSIKINKIVSIESRGFILGSALAYKLNCGFIPIRKKGKLPYKTVSITYDLEYGKDCLEIHTDAIKKGENILIVDDVLATGGTAKAVVDLINKLNAKIVGLCFLIELSYLHGKEKLHNYDIFSLIKY